MTACRLYVSKKSTLDEAEQIAPPAYDMVNDSHVDELKTRFHPLCDQLVRVALIADHGRVIVKHHDGRRLFLKDKFYDLARIHARPVDCSTEEFHTLNDLKSFVSQHQTEYFVVQCPKLYGEIFVHRSRRT